MMAATTVDPAVIPAIAPGVAPGPLRRLMPGETCPAQKEQVVREIERVI